MPDIRPRRRLRADDLVKTYPRRTRHDRRSARSTACPSTSSRGTVFALLGPNGAGKSTTVRILTTLSRPDSGTRDASPASTSPRDPDAVRRAIGLVSQKPSGDPMATGRENLVLAARIQGLSARRRRAARRRAARPGSASPTPPTGW